MSQSSFTCALVAASNFNAAHFRARVAEGAYDRVIAVDGGFAHLKAVGFVPDLVLGDFDSLGYIPQDEAVEVHPTHKDESDLELALMRVFAEGCCEAEVYGALGGRVDHTVAALQMCARFAESGMRMTLIGAESAVRILVGPGTFSIPARESGTVSVFSATEESFGVTERGLEYPLDNARLKNRTTLGLSNELIGKPASVSLERGTLYVFYPLQR